MNQANKELIDALLAWSIAYTKKPVPEYRKAFLAGNLTIMKHIKGKSCPDTAIPSK